MTLVGNNKGFTAVEGLLLAILVVLLGAIGFFVYERSNDDTDDETPIATVIESGDERPQDSGDSSGATTDASAVEASFEADGKNVTYSHPPEWTSEAPIKSTDLSVISHTEGYTLRFTTNNTELPGFEGDESDVEINGNSWNKKLLSQGGIDSILLYIPHFDAPFVNVWVDLPNEITVERVEEIEQILATMSISEV